VFAALGFVYFLRKNCVAILSAEKEKSNNKKSKSHCTDRVQIRLCNGLFKIIKLNFSLNIKGELIILNRTQVNS
jgi:hypothetical protein